MTGLLGCFVDFDGVGKLLTVVAVVVPRLFSIAGLLDRLLLLINLAGVDGRLQSILYLVTSFILYMSAIFLIKIIKLWVRFRTISRSKFQ